MNIIGMQSTAYSKNDKFGIDFLKFTEAGVRSLDFQDFMQIKSKLYKMNEEDFVNYLINLKNEANKHHLIFNQLHSVWDPNYIHDHPDEDYGFYYERSLRGASLLGCKYVVMHTISKNDIFIWDSKLNNKQLFDINFEFFKGLIPIAKKYKVKIAIENLPFLNGENFFSPSETLRLVNTLNSEHIVMCLDTGHFNVFNEDIYDFLINGKDKVKCFHIHDNYGTSDTHNLIYDGTFDWNKFAKAIKDIEFDGVLSLETYAHKEKHNNDELLCHELNKKLVISLKELIK